MLRLRLALALATLPALAAPVATAAADPASVARIKLTHRVSASVEFVNRWSISASDECAWAGSGTLTVKARTARSTAVVPEINRSAGRWTILVPYFRAARDMPPVRATGTITREDDTAQNPRSDGEPCDETKTGCGAVPARNARISVSGVDRRRIAVDLRVRRFDIHTGTCKSGEVRSLSDSSFFGSGSILDVDERLRIRMPSARALRRRVVRVSNSSRKSRREEPNQGEVYTDNVVRRATVTFRRR